MSCAAAVSRVAVLPQVAAKMHSLTLRLREFGNTLIHNTCNLSQLPTELLILHW